MLEFKNISKSYRGHGDFWKKKEKVINDLSFSIAAETATGFLGANGAGKTTALKIAFGLTNSDSGHAIFDPSLGKTKMEAFSNVGYMPERPYFHLHLTCTEFLTYMGNLQGLGGEKLKESITRWLDKMGIGYAHNRMIKGLSKGMLQRLGFAAALIHEPKLVILDEPMAGLDPRGRIEFKDIMRELVKDGKTLFFSSHIVSDIEEVCKNVVIIEKGDLVYSGEVHKLISKSNENMFEIVLEAANDPELGMKPQIMEKVLGVPLVYYQIGRNGKDEFLNKCVLNKLNIIRVREMTPTLEQLVYDVK